MKTMATEDDKGNLCTNGKPITKKVGTNGSYARNPNSYEEDILHGADVDVNTFTFNSVSVFCL